MENQLTTGNHRGVILFLFVVTLIGCVVMGFAMNLRVTNVSIEGGCERSGCHEPPRSHEIPAERDSVARFMRRAV